jgi:hypothetical protein
MNRRVHSSIGTTPYKAWWDKLPDLSLLKVFGSRVCVKVTGKSRVKLDRHDFIGNFVEYTATDDNIRYIDTSSRLVKTSHRAVFDEAWYFQPHRPPAAQLLLIWAWNQTNCSVVHHHHNLDLPHLTLNFLSKSLSSHPHRPSTLSYLSVLVQLQ